MFNIGDTVMILPHARDARCSHKDCTFFVDDMVPFIGRTATITKIIGDSINRDTLEAEIRYRIDLDNGGFSWSECMLGLPKDIPISYDSIYIESLKKGGKNSS